MCWVPISQNNFSIAHLPNTFVLFEIMEVFGELLIRHQLRQAPIRANLSSILLIWHWKKERQAHRELLPLPLTIKVLTSLPRSINSHFQPLLTTSNNKPTNWARSPEPERYYIRRKIRYAHLAHEHLQAGGLIPSSFCRHWKKQAEFTRGGYML